MADETPKPKVVEVAAPKLVQPKPAAKKVDAATTPPAKTEAKKPAPKAVKPKSAGCFVVHVQNILNPNTRRTYRCGEHSLDDPWLKELADNETRHHGVVIVTRAGK